MKAFSSLIRCQHAGIRQRAVPAFRSSLAWQSLRGFSTELVEEPDKFVDSPEEMENKYIVGTYSDKGVRFTPGVAFTHGKAMKLFDQKGHAWLDFGAGIAVTALGHADKEWAKAVAKQAKQLCHVSNLYHSQPYLRLAEKLVKNSKLDKVFFCNSGTEANEAALKFAKLFSRRMKQSSFACEDGSKACETVQGMCHCWSDPPSKGRVIAFKKGFHGRTMGALSVTHKPGIREPFGPLVGDVSFATFNDLKSVEALMGDDVCAIIVEPIQGEGGVYPATVPFMRGLREICDKHEALLIADEVQCGLGRTGQLWAHEQYGIVPDIMTLAKPLAGGLPIGAVLVTDEVSSRVPVGSHGTTFGGSALSCRAAEVVLDRLTEKDFMENVRRVGKRMIRKLRGLKLAYPTIITDVRAPLGDSALFAGVDLTVPAKLVIEEAAEFSVIFLSAGEKTLRLAPALIATKEDVDVAMEVLECSIVAADKVARKAARENRSL